MISYTFSPTSFKPSMTSPDAVFVRLALAVWVVVPSPDFFGRSYSGLRRMRHVSCLCRKVSSTKVSARAEA